MEKSLFFQWVEKHFKPIAQKIVEKINGTTNSLTYLHKTMLRPLFSTTLKWSSLSSNNTMVSADVVAIDSSLPLKRRDSLRKYEGDIPKLGMKLYLNERTMNDLGILQRTQGQEKEIIRKLFADTNKCVNGIYEALEFMFLQALSSGVTSITDEDNPGQAIRIDFGIPSDNKYTAGVAAWSDPVNSRPLDDIQAVLTAAQNKGNIIRFMFTDVQTMNNLKNSQQVRDRWAFSVGTSVQSAASIPTLNNDKINELFLSEFGITLVQVNRSVVFEKDGVRTSKNPWETASVTFTTEMNVGSLTYGRLAEEDHPANQVTYTKVDDFILLSKYHKNDPIREFTSSQALVLPVLDNTDAIYLLDSAESAPAPSV